MGFAPADVVAVPRDRVERLAAYLPAVEAIETLSRVETGSTVEVRRRWRLDAGALPAGLRSAIPDHAVGFEDHLVFDGHHAARFAIRPLVHPDAVRCEGRLAVHEEGLDTSLEIDAELTLTPAGLALLPSALGDGGAAAIESAVIAAIRAQLRQALRAIEALLDDEL
ncbi:MAG: hypothetical protein H6737_22780 [Alphaproteobacteria bacterium]|nr:hypothetical protein [Alphaproteobacteria bacterium]